MAMERWTSEQVGKQLHELREEYAPLFGCKKTNIPWENLSEKEKRLALAVAHEMLHRFEMFYKVTPSDNIDALIDELRRSISSPPKGS